MATSRLTASHIEAERRLRVTTATATERLWRSLPAYDERNVDQWLSGVVPLVTAAQARSVHLTDAYLARAMSRATLGIVPADVIGKLRTGIPAEEVYRRPFITVWHALGANTLYEDAVASGLARASSTAAMDVQLAARGTFQEVQEADDGIYGYERAADPGACAFCAEVDGAYVKSADAMPLHNNCGCGLEPLTSPHARAANLPSGVAVHEHGELGPILTDPAHDFTTAAQALS